MRKALLDYSRCMRENGIDMPDPKFEGNRVTHARRRPGARPVDPDKMKAAEKACAKYRDAVKPPEMSAREGGGVQEGGAGQRQVHARARHRHAGPDVRRERRGADEARALGSTRSRRSSRRPRKRARTPAGSAPARRRPTLERRSDEAPGRWRRRRGGARRGGSDRRRWRGAPSRAAEPPAPARATATVERRDLVDRENLSGTLGYADPGTLAASAAGTLTAVREPGSVITRGHSLYDLDDEPAAFLLYGALPAWRDFAPGMTDGEDVRQLERNLRALGNDPGDVDDDWDWETTDAVEQFQLDRDLDDDGTLARGEVVFRRARRGSARRGVRRRLDLAGARRWRACPRPSGS